MSKISIIGTGYVGLVTGTCLASLGHNVCCFDVDESKIRALKNGAIPILEEGLPELIRKTQAEGFLTFRADIEAAVREAEFVFLCVPTPQDASGAADVSYVRAAAEMIAPHLDHSAVVVNKSTVPIGTTEMVRDVVNRSDVYVVSNPEFLREGSAVADFLNPDRVIVGGSDTDAVDRVASLYEPIARPIFKTDGPSAEMIKYAANAFLATKISFINGIASICEKVGADIRTVAVGLGADSRIGQKFLAPGPGWGGSCFPKDTQALLSLARSINYQFHVLEGAYQTNQLQISRTTDRILALLGHEREGKAIAIWGLTFKAGTDDLRDSPAIAIIDRLLTFGVQIRAYDPTVAPCSSLLGRSIACFGDPLEACDGADALAVLTEWDIFSQVQPQQVAVLLKNKCVLDARRILDRGVFEEAGVIVDSIGVAAQ